VQKAISFTPDEEIKDADKSDTLFSPGSLNAAKRAAGSVIHAIDAVLSGTHRNAFCVVRPPGHHAGVSGLTSDAVSCGFCLFNTIAIGALHALERRQVSRVAIVDFDVHHGNGTQGIIEQLQAKGSGSGVDASSLFFYSVHLYDSDRGCPNCHVAAEDQLGGGTAPSRGGGGGGARPPAAQGYYEFYPGSGAEDVMARNIVNSPLVPLWHYGSPRERRGGGEPHGRGSRDSLGGSAEAAAAAQSLRRQEVPRGRVAFRHAVRQRLVPSLRAFDPDLVLLSAGFDGGSTDQGNVNLDDELRPNGLDLEEADFEWLTRQLLGVANVCCEGRVVSVLEGGYGTQVHDRHAEKWFFNRDHFAAHALAHTRALAGQ
jgi:acetoin utilization deacetylase AcuC-like enzyme